MYAREWKCRLPLDKRDGFIGYLCETGVKETSALAGFQGCQILARELDGRAEVTLITYWDDMSSIKAFAGEDISQAKLYPEDAKYGLEPELTVRHYQVIGRRFVGHGC